MFEKLQLTDLIRWGYGGFLLTGIAALFAPSEVKEAIEVGGTVVAPLVILAIGAAVYLLHRYVIGELLVYPLTRFTHFLIDKYFHGGVPSSPTGFLGDRGVGFWQRRAAYTEIRRGFFQENQRKRLDLDHSEAHVLWLTAVECTGACIYAASGGSTSDAIFRLFLIAAFAATISAMALDIRIHQNEHRLLSRYSSDVEAFLRNEGYTR